MKVFGGIKMGRIGGPFNKRLVKRPSFLPDVVDIQESNKLVIDPPRSIKLGIIINHMTGEEMGDFYLPFDTREHETGVIIIGATGSGKSVALGRIHSELAFQYSRSQTIFDFKNQYRLAYKPNDNPKHVEILKANGERPRGVNAVRCFLPVHIIDRWGEEFCKLNYGYSDTWRMSINDCDAAGLLMLGQKETEGRGYVNILDAAMTVVRRRDGKITIDSLTDELEAMKEELPGSKKSVDALTSMMATLVKTRVLADKGNNILELMHPPKKPGLGGEFFVFNLAGAGPDDIQTKGMLVNLLNGICHTLKTRLDVQPVLGLEEASVFFGRDSINPYLKGALNQLHYVVGRTEGILRIYVFQKKEQVPIGLLDDKGVSIVIETMNNFTLGNGESIFGAGYAKIYMRNLTFMPSDVSLVRILPPKCQILS